MIIQKLRAKSCCLRDFARCLAEKNSSAATPVSPCPAPSAFLHVDAPDLAFVRHFVPRKQPTDACIGRLPGSFFFFDRLSSDQSSNLTSRPVLEDS
jgi:hypothetical protein